MRRSRHSRASRGFSLPFVLIAAAILLTGGLMLAMRSSDGLLSILLQAESSDARDAAETGITRIVGELNKPWNRGLLVKDGQEGVDDDSDGYLWTSAAATAGSPCPPTGSGDPDKADVATNASVGFREASPPAYRTVFLNEEGQVIPVAVDSQGQPVAVPSDAVKSYRLLAVKRQPLRASDGRPALRIFDAGGRGRVVLTVEGSALRNGRVISTVRLEEELQLVPKCCGVSFGGAHGNTVYEPDSAGDSVCLPNGLGMMAGLANQGTGSMTINGVTTILDEKNNVVNPLFCVAASTAECDFNPTSTPFTLQLVQPTSFPSVRTNPVVPETVTGSISKDTDLSKFPKAGTQESFVYCTDAVEKATGTLKDCPGGKVTINAAAAPEMFVDPQTGELAREDGISYCVVANYAVNPESSDALHCNLALLDYSQLEIEVKGTPVEVVGTQARALRLYFPKADAVIRGTGGATLKHGGDAGGFALFGCASCTGQTIRLAGGAEGLHLFAWFPMGAVTVAGGSEYTGVIWANQITSNGGVAWTIPSAELLAAVQLAGFDLNGDLNPPLFDWVARSVRSFRWLGL